MPLVLRTDMLSQFTCLGENCEDTCCQNWSMQVDDATRERYQAQAPELMDAIEPSQDTPWVMRKNTDTGFCIKLDNGLCGIHKTYGDAFLSDACYFYPRITRQLGEQVVMAATMSCPEITRLAINGDNPFSLRETTLDRLPHTLKNYLPDGIEPSDALMIHKAFVDAAENETADAEQVFLRIASTSRSLERIDRKSWPAMVPFYLKNADMRIPPAEKNISDPFNLLHMLCGLIVASRRPPSKRLRQTIADMERALSVTLDWEKAQINTQDNSLMAYQQLQTLWRREAAALYTPVLKRWLQMQMSLALYPFSGLGVNLEERITLIGVRLAINKLALLCAHSIYKMLGSDELVRIMQSLSRFLDHLGDAGFSLTICEEMGWGREARMRGLLEK